MTTYNTLKALTKTRQQKSAVIEDSRGNILTQNTAALNRWAEYCSGPYNYKLHPDTHHHHHQQHHHHHLSLNREGRWGTTDDFATSFLHFYLFSTALWDLANSRPVHSLTLSSHLFLCLSCLLPPFTVPCKMALARTDEREI